MGSAGIQFVPFPANSQGPEVGARAKEIQELWFNLARLRWSSLVVVPAEDGIEAEALARSLADIGSRLRDAPVTAILASSMDYESARFLSDLELRVRDQRGAADVPRGQTVDVPTEAVEESGQGAPGARAWSGDEGGVPPVGQVIVAIQPVVVEPLGVAIAHAADAVLVCVRLGSTRMRAVRKTLELIGGARHVNAVVVR